MPVQATPTPSGSRGELTLQPAYFTSSLFVGPLRDDVLTLTHIFAEQYARSQERPFALFKQIWDEQGWVWMHFRMIDARAREAFLNVTCRSFLERLVKTEAPLSRVVALFGLYTFFYTQPFVGTPPLYSVSHVPVPLDIYKSLITLPSTLTTPHLLPLRPHVIYVLKVLLDAQVLYILPSTPYYALNPRALPREVFVQDCDDLTVPDNFATPDIGIPKKRKGRPSKRERVKKAKDALATLKNWLDRDDMRCSSDAGTSVSTIQGQPLASNPPSASRGTYRQQKSELLQGLDDEEGRRLLERVNQAGLARMRKVDQLAAEKGLEVGGEGGERTGLARVEKAVQGMVGSKSAGLLGLLEGEGLDETSIPISWTGLERAMLNG